MTVADQLIMEGRKEGRKEGYMQTAKKFLKMGILTPEQISEGTGLPLSVIEEMSKTIKNPRGVSKVK